MYIPDWDLVNTFIALVGVLGSSLAIMRELSPGTQLNYSKFTATSGSSKSPSGITIPSIYGMLIIYMPSLAVFTVFLFKSSHSNRMLLVSLLNFFHYLKRVMEVLFVHRYSGQSKLLHNCSISMSYVSFSILTYFFSAQVPQINTSMTALGITFFFIGEYINFYHHLILRDLRKGGSIEYKIPSKGLFRYAWCPHYTGEIISFISMGLVTQHVVLLILHIGSIGYLATRAYNTREWYKQRFLNAPNRACLVPFIY